MRVDWVHPSWRDLVIEALARDDDERRALPARCGVDGAALALSSGGGAAGERERPLLREDADWDALGDGLHHLLRRPRRGRGDPAAQRARARPATTPRCGRWPRSCSSGCGWAGKAVSVDALGAWAAVAAKLDPRPEPPAVAMTWLELEPPARAGDAARSSSAFADWLRLAELLHEHDPELLEGLGFPERYERRARGVRRPTRRATSRVLERELRIETLARLAALDDGARPSAALSESLALQRIEAVEPLPTSWCRRPTAFPVERVLRLETL